MPTTKAASLGAIAYLLAVFSLKLFAISDSEIIVSPYDAVAYAHYGVHWFWGIGPWYGPVHPPGYPLWLALVRPTGIPQRVAMELFYLVSCAYLSIAAALVARRRWLFYALLPVLAFAPVTFDIFRQLLSDTLATALGNIVVAAGILSVADRRCSVVHSILLASSLGFWSITRPEAPFMFCYLMAILVFLVARAIVANHGWRPLVRQTALTCLLPGLSILGFESGVRMPSSASPASTSSTAMP